MEGLNKEDRAIYKEFVAGEKRKATQAYKSKKQARRDWAREVVEGINVEGLPEPIDDIPENVEEGGNEEEEEEEGDAEE